jgi:serine/threonine protein kinase
MSTGTAFAGALNYTSVVQYSLGSNLGQGAYAQVKQAYHKETGLNVAIKIYDKFKLSANAQMKKSVQREIRLLSILSNTDQVTAADFGKGHPNIMKLFDAIDTPKQLYLVLENVPG